MSPGGQSVQPPSFFLASASLCGAARARDGMPVESTNPPGRRNPALCQAWEEVSSGFAAPSECISDWVGRSAPRRVADLAARCGRSEADSWRHVHFGRNVHRCGNGVGVPAPLPGRADGRQRQALDSARRNRSETEACSHRDCYRVIPFGGMGEVIPSLLSPPACSDT